VNSIERPNPVAPEPATVEVAEKAPLRTWLVALLLIFGPLLLLVLYSHRMVAGLVSPDAMDYAQIGRNLLAGHGLTTQILRPLGLTDSANPLAQADLTHGPLYPFLLALAFGLAGAKDSVVLGMSGLFYLLTAPALYFLGKRLFSAQVGMLAALVFMTNGSILEYAAAGTPTTLVMFLATCLFLTLFQAASLARREGENETEKIGKAPFVVAGLLAGLLYLTDPLFIWILPVLTVAIPLMLPAKSTNQRATAAGYFLVPLALLTLPSMLRFFLLTGNPLFGLRGAELWMGTKAYPGFVAYRLSQGDIVGGFGSIKGILLKLFVGAAGATTSLLHLPAGWVLLFVLPGLFFGFADPALGRLRTIVFACLISVLAGSLFLSFTPAVLMVVFPGLLVFALRYLVHLVRQAQLPHSSRVMVNGLFGFALLSPLVVSLVTTLTPTSVPQVAAARSLNRQSRPDEVVFSDQPWIVAWYADRPSVWIPVSNTKMAAVRKQFVKARWLFLTPEAARLSPEWNMALNSLLGWDREYQEAERTGAPLPSALPITRSQAPITEALEGFAALPPEEQGVLTAVVASAPLQSATRTDASDKPAGK
jgi:hypothetical protein